MAVKAILTPLVRHKALSTGRSSGRVLPSDESDNICQVTKPYQRAGRPDKATAVAAPRAAKSQSPINGQVVRTEEAQTSSMDMICHKALSTGRSSGLNWEAVVNLTAT